MGSIWNPDSPTLAPTIPASQGVGASIGGEMLNEREGYTGLDRAYAQLFSPDAMQPVANVIPPVARNVNNFPIGGGGISDVTRAPIDPSGVSEMMPGRMEWQMDDTVRDMDEINYGITNQPPYKVQNASDYYTPAPEMGDLSGWRDHVMKGWGIENEFDLQNFMKTSQGRNAFKAFQEQNKKRQPIVQDSFQGWGGFEGGVG